MRSAPGDAWQVMRGEGGRVERRHRGIVRSGCPELLAAVCLCVAGMDNYRKSDKYLKDFIDMPIFLFYLFTEIAIGGNAFE